MAESLNISELLNRVGRIVHGVQFANGLNPAQWEALRFLSRANCYSRTPGALAEYLGSTKGTVSQTLISLESKGYVVRTRSKHDRRSVDIALTDDGRELVEQDPLAMIEAAVEGLTDVDRDGFARSMGALIKSLQRNLGQVEFGDCGGCVHNQIDGEFGESCRCLFMDEPLSVDDTSLICLNFQSNRPDS
jgi:DNA-binding MarR family transcriptional regulator